MNGKECECFARCEVDCVCGADLTPPEVKRLRSKLSLMKIELRAITIAMNDERIDNTITLAEAVNMLKAENESIKDAFIKWWCSEIDAAEFFNSMPASLRQAAIDHATKIGVFKTFEIPRGE